MYKIVGVGKNNIRIELANNKELITFPSEKDALAFIHKMKREGEIIDGYHLVIEKV